MAKERALSLTLIAVAGVGRRESTRFAAIGGKAGWPKRPFGLLSYVSELCGNPKAELNFSTKVGPTQQVLVAQV